MKILATTLTTGARNKTFQACLQSLISQTFSQSKDFAILVIENNRNSDPEVQKIVRKFREKTSVRIYHELERKPGIPYARNRAIQLANELQFTHLSFIDDDAIADERWIEQLAECANQNNCEAVTGPQKALFPEKTKPFFTIASVYHERSIKNGEIVTWGATNNLLLDLSFLAEQSLTFNGELVHGGEDKELMLRFTDNGGEIRWCETAVVKEYIAEERLNYGWAIKRTFRLGATGFKIEQCNKSKLKAIVVCLFKGSTYLARGVVTLPVYFFLPKKSALDSACDLTHGFGFYFGLFTDGTVSSYT